MAEINADAAILPYEEKLQIIRSLLEKEDVEKRDVESRLGNGIAALESVPTALYCFLQALKVKDTTGVRKAK